MVPAISIILYNGNTMCYVKYLNFCLHLINRIKEHRLDKIKARQIDKFKYLHFRKYAYHHNFTRGSKYFDNINTANVTLSGHSHLPPSSSSTRSNASGAFSTPAAPMAPAPSVPTPLAPKTPSVAPSHNPSGSRHTCTNSDNKQKCVINLSNGCWYKYTSTRIPIGKRPKLCHSPKVPPKESYNTVVEEACSKLPPGKQMKSDQTSATYLGTTSTKKPTSPYKNAEH